MSSSDLLIETKFLIKSSKKRVKCVCCLTDCGPFVNLTNCSHTNFLECIFKFYDFHSTLVCNTCHSQLKNITRFQQQVSRSYSILKDEIQKTNIQPINKHLVQSKIEVFSTEQEPPPKELAENTTTTPKELQNEPAKESVEQCGGAYECLVKVERDSSIESSSDNDMLLASLKKTERTVTVKGLLITPQQNLKHKKPAKYNERISIITLSEKEMLEERERDRKRPSYLNLMYKCLKCIVGFDHEQNLIEHNMRHHAKRPNGISCKICGSEFLIRGSFLQHWKRHFTRYGCNICGLRRPSIYSISQHYNREHDNTTVMSFKCDKCEFVTTSHRSFRNHKYVHKTKPICPECGNCFINNNGLKVHMFTVHKKSNRKYSCDLCTKVYTTRSGLIGHKKSIHGPRDAHYCVTCNKSYNSETSLRTHYKNAAKHVSEEDKRFTCAECGSKHMNKSRLLYHMNHVHIGLPPEKCDQCDKSFINKSALRRHNDYVHKKKRPAKTKICDHCGKGFTTMSILRTHIRTHTGERPLICRYCNATFAHSGALYTHTKLLHKNTDK